MDDQQNQPQTAGAVSEIDTFVSEVIDKRLAKEGETIDAPTREAISKVLLNQLGIFILESTFEELSEEQQAEFRKMIEEKKTSDELREYASSHIDDYDDFMGDVLLDFEDAYLAGELDQEDPREAYIDNLIEQKQFPNLTPEVREEISQDIAKRLDEFVMTRTLAKFSQEDLAAFKQMLSEQKPKAELQQFAMNHIADYPSFLDETLMSFQEAYLS